MKLKEKKETNVCQNASVYRVQGRPFAASLTPCVRSVCASPARAPFQTYSEATGTNLTLAKPYPMPSPSYRRSYACPSRMRNMNRKVSSSSSGQKIESSSSRPSLCETPADTLAPCRIVQHFQNIGCTNGTVLSAAIAHWAGVDFKWTRWSAQSRCELPIALTRWRERRHLW